MGVLACKKHPDYNGVVQPLIACEWCWSYYWTGRYFDFEEEEEVQGNGDKRSGDRGVEPGK